MSQADKMLSPGEMQRLIQTLREAASTIRLHLQISYGSLARELDVLADTVERIYNR
ncbi:hypothetical protein K9N68_37590 (plasmid) [Kovacikia minuta CCNUW1]|uniref:hypothetical protein n=1 Tax=Kovacikia minuta TaxID=2931930 RepID=UPI001CCF9DCA|nr:hypothetical protein [Kovacikia minuta]UBF29927.1 hypothetical protein K9N68_37590 [Kovacikia minuta CCNUW1]